MSDSSVEEQPLAARTHLQNNTAGAAKECYTSAVNTSTEAWHNPSTDRTEEEH